MSSDIAGHILVVDDQENWRQALRILLEGAGFSVSEASSFDQAKNIITESAFDIVVLDVRLVDEDTFNVEGLALLNLVRENHPNSRVIILTGYSSSVKDESVADAFILKVPPGSSFDTVGFKNLVKILVQEVIADRACGEDT